MSYGRSSIMASPVATSRRPPPSPKMSRFLNNGSPSMRRRNNDYNSGYNYSSTGTTSHYDNTMMYGTARRARDPVPRPRALPPGPGPLDATGRKMDKSTIKDSFRENKSTNKHTGRAPVKAVYTDKTYYNDVDKNIKPSSPSSPYRSSSFSKGRKSQSMSDLSGDLNRLELSDSPSSLSRSSRQNKGSSSHLNLDANKHYDVLQGTQRRDDSRKDDFELGYKSSSVKATSTVSSHPYVSKNSYLSSVGKETLTATLPTQITRDNRSMSVDRDYSREPVKMSKTDTYQQPPSRRRASLSTVPITSKAGLVGLKNLGNTCFMNSILQCLSNTRPLQEYCLKKDYQDEINKTSDMKGQLMTAFANLILTMWTSTSDYAVNPSVLHKQVQKFAPQFSGYGQHDSQEFLRFLLEGLHDDINKIQRKPRYNDEIPDDISNEEKARVAWNRYNSREQSKISDQFVGQLKSTLTCTVCQHSSVTFDPFWDLSLPIPKTSSSYRDEVSLRECLQLFTKEEILDGMEKPTCSRCQTKRKCIKKLSIQRFPSILVLHLKRFSSSRYRSKLTTNVDFSLEDLNLKEFSAHGVSAPYYSLYGVSNHSGSTYGGHYIAFCKHSQTQDWYEFNDSRVDRMSSSRVVSSTAYVLFYEKVK
ncbi:ubiquitin carboxyl-terminal hydrolase 2-like [Glandiceps talaboti]